MYFSDVSGRQSIDSFDGDYRFLSNFYANPNLNRGVQTSDGAVFKTVENAYQSLKFEHLWTKEKRENPSKYGIPSSFDDDWLVITDGPPGKSKRKAKKYAHLVDPAFHGRKYDIMFELVYSKFERDSELQQMLLDTAACELIEGNTWGDTYWGVCNGSGQNNLGKILMDVRTIFQL